LSAKNKFLSITKARLLGHKIKDFVGFFKTKNKTQRGDLYGRNANSEIKD